MVGARRQAEPRNRLPEQTLGSRLRPAPALDFTCAETAVALALALDLHLVCRGDARPHRAAGFARALAQQVFLRHSRHRDVDVDAIQQWPGDAAAITCNLIRRAATTA